MAHLSRENLNNIGSKLFLFIPKFRTDLKEPEKYYIIPQVTWMFKNNTNYLVEFTQNTAKQILQNSESYVGRLVTDKEVLLPLFED